MYHDGVFCPCCGMQLRTTPTITKNHELIYGRRHTYQRNRVFIYRSIYSKGMLGRAVSCKDN
jgi:hypothetical protein